MSDDFGGMNSTADEAQDFSADGLPVGDHTWTITDTEEVEKENGKQWSVEFTSETAPFPIKVREWVSHTNETAQRIGRGNLKKIGIAAIGQPKYSLPQLKGLKVVAKLSEDKDGFARLSGFKKAPTEVAAVAGL